ncbi:MAG TPA: DUF2959 domain-containing protein [Steroidobacteraceae bacterium]|nr:DUF2959 domain-containing protein [Steroidobacteraceae bacterium]
MQPLRLSSNASAQRPAPSARWVLAAAIALIGIAGCSSVYYSALESLGIEKREILVDRVDDARDAQTEAKEQFASALEQYRSVVSVDAAELESFYDRMNREFERSEDRARAVSERIEAVESVAEDLFEEWTDELGQYTDPALRRRSERLLGDTRRQYEQLIAAMHRAEGAMDPVLALFRDQVLVLRHSLNARAIGALENELADIERATAALIAEMQRAIDEASAFIDAMES